MSYPHGSAPHLPPAPQGSVTGGLSGARLAASLVWALAPLYTCGLLGFAVIGSAAVRLRSWLQGVAALGYLGVTIVGFIAANSTGTASDVVTFVCWTIMSIGALVHALLIREAVFRPSAPPFAAPGGAPPGFAPPYQGAPVTPGPHTPVPGPVTPNPHAPVPLTPPTPLPGSWPAPGPGPRDLPTAPGRGGWSPAATSATPQPRRFGPYLLLDKLGEGGQGAVYLAQHPDGSRVALKMLHHRLSDKEREGFIREVAAAQRVPSYSTARVIDAGVLDGIAYIVSEYVSGSSLERKVRESGPLDGDSLIRLAIATSGALAAIHKAGIVHRDFKPANVLLAPDGPRVIDFGVAKALDQVTTTAGIKGTPLYMSPEQINGGPITPASDMFSWASTMIYGGTGRVAFSGSNPYQVLHQIMSMEPDLSGLPGPLIRPVAACLDKNPANRPQAAELIAAITG